LDGAPADAAARATDALHHGQRRGGRRAPHASDAPTRAKRRADATTTRETEEREGVVEGAGEFAAALGGLIDSAAASPTTSATPLSRFTYDAWFSAVARTPKAREWTSEQASDVPPPHERVPAAALRMCRPEHNKLNCRGNDDCSQRVCEHRAINYEMINGSEVAVVSYFMADMRKGLAVRDRLAETTAERMQFLRGVVREMEARMGPNDGLLMLMSFNSGYGWLFSNWVCSLLRNNVSLAELRPHLLVIPTDEGAQSMVESLGFFTTDLSPMVTWLGTTVASRAALRFGLGAHSKVNAVLKFAALHDALALGLDVVIMDVDMVWSRNALPVIRAVCADARCHGAFIQDNRPFGPAFKAPPEDKGVSSESFWRASAALPDGPNENPYQIFNTGLFFMRSSPRTVNFLRLTASLVQMQQWTFTDQLLFNSVAYHHAMRDMRWVHLPRRRFVPGGALHRNQFAINFAELPPGTLVVVHGSDTTTAEDKVRRLGRFGHFYLRREGACAPLFDRCAAMKVCMPPGGLQPLLDALEEELKVERVTYDEANRRRRMAARKAAQYAAADAATALSAARAEGVVGAPSVRGVTEQ